MTPVFLVIVLDCRTRETVGWTLDRRCRAVEWCAAVRAALKARRLEDKQACRELGLVPRGDNGAQPCSKAFVKFLASRGVSGEYTGYDALDDKALVEGVIRTVKQEEIRPNIHSSLSEAREALGASIQFSTNERIQSSLELSYPLGGRRQALHPN
jgi:transposase InsO family protein